MEGYVYKLKRQNKDNNCMNNKRREYREICVKNTVKLKLRMSVLKVLSQMVEANSSKYSRAGKARAQHLKRLLGKSHLKDDKKHRTLMD